MFFSYLSFEPADQVEDIVVSSAVDPKYNYRGIIKVNQPQSIHL